MSRTCDLCWKDLIPVFPDRMRRSTDFPQYEDALVVTFKGGYGMFFDDKDIQYIFCKGCAEDIPKKIGLVSEEDA